jgi:putative inorganic carbon (HCO3(-)) transporter
VWVLRRRTTGRFTRRTPLDGPAVVLLLMVPVTLLVTTDRAVTLLAVSRLLAGLSLAYGFANWADGPGRRAALVLGMVAVGLVLALLTPLTLTWPPGPLAPVPPSWHRRPPQLLADPLNPNMVAGALVLLLPFPLVLLWTLDRWPRRLPLVPAGLARWLRRRKVRRAVAWIVLALLLLALWMTQSRGGWIAGATVLFVSLALRSPRLWAGLPLLGGALAWMARRGVLMPLLDALGTGGAVTGWAERIEIWSRALYIVQDFPFTGIGAGTYSDVVALLYPLFLTAPGTVVPHAHNLLLAVAVDLGLPGLIAFLALLMVAAVCGVRVVRRPRARHPLAVALSRAALAALAGMLVHGLVDATTWITGWAAPLPWALVGLLSASDLTTELAA